MAFERIIQTKYDASTTGFDRGTRRVEQNLKRLDRTAGSRLNSIDRRFEKAARGATKLGAAIAAFASVQGLRRLQAGIEGAVSKLDNIAKTADKLGITTAALQELRIAAELSGVSAQTFDMAFQRFTRRSGEAAQGTGEAKDALKQLGVTLDDLNNRSPEQLFNQVADAIARVEDPAERLRLAFKLFDSEGAALVNALTSGSAGLDQMRQKARDLGIVIEEDLIRRSVQAQDELTLISKVIDSNVTVALANLGPVLVDLSEFFVTLSSVLPDSSEEMEAFASALKVTAVTAAVVAGSRGFGAVTSGVVGVTKAMIEGTAARKAAVVASRELVATTQAEVQSRRLALVSLQRKITQQAVSEKGVKNLTAANKSLATARTALTAAEAKAAAATNTLAAAQTRLSLAARTTTAAMTALRGALAFVGGVPGLIFAAASAAVYFATTLGDGAEQAEDLNVSVSSLQSAVAGLEQAQMAYRNAISATAGAQGAATSSIVADTKREFEAKKALLELEVKRQEAAQAVRQAEIQRVDDALRSREGSASREVRDPTGRVIERSPQEIEARQAQINELRDDLKRLGAEATLASLALDKAEAALGTEFKDPGGGGGGEEDATTRAAGSARSAAAATDELREARDLIVDTTERQMTAEEKLAAAQERIKALLPAIIELTGDRAKAEEIAAQAIEQAREDLIGPSPFDKLADDISGAIEQAQSFEEALNGVLLKIFEIAANDFFNSIFGNQTSGVFGDIFGGLFGGGTDATVAHTGGTIGQSALPSRNVPSALFANAPRYHDGGIAGLKPNEVPAILERGEIVLPKNVGMSRGGSNVVIGDTNLTITQPNMSEAQLRQVLAENQRKTIEAVRRLNEDDPTFLHT